jgi:hypothetical protein
MPPIESYLDRLHCGHALDVLRDMPAASVHAVVTSIPSWRVTAKKSEVEKWPGSLVPVSWPEMSYRAYPGGEAVGIPAMRGSLGLESEDDGDAYVGHVLLVVRELARILRPDGAMCLVLEDWPGPYGNRLGPHRVMMALQAEYLDVIDCIWHKTEVRPAGAMGRVRPVMAHEHAVRVYRHDQKPYYDMFAMNEATTDAARRGSTVTFGETERGGLQALYAGPGDGMQRHGRDVLTTAGASDLSRSLARRLVASVASIGMCCSVCGAPRIRSLNVQRNFHGPAQPDGRGGFPSIPAPQVDAEGWMLNCEHVPQGVTPAIVLDPFMGDGTVLREAACERMRIIGIDIDPLRVEANASLLDRVGGRTQHTLFTQAFRLDEN